jgi:hypothetical protein
LINAAIISFQDRLLLPWETRRYGTSLKTQCN